MAPCSGKPKCGCGCPKKKRVARKKAPAKARPQFGGAVMQSYPGIMGTQFTPSLTTPIPSAVSKMTGDKRTAEIGTQTEPKVKKETVKKLKEILSTPMPVEKPIEPAKREMSRSGIAAIARSQSAKPTERVGNVVSFAPEPEEQKPMKVEDIKPRRGRPPGARALGKNALPGVQKVIEPLLVSLAPQAR